MIKTSVFRKEIGLNTATVMLLLLAVATILVFWFPGHVVNRMAH